MEQIKPIRSEKEAQIVYGVTAQMVATTLNISLLEAEGRVQYATKSKILNECGQPDEPVFQIIADLLMQLPTNISSQYAVGHVKMVIIQKAEAIIKSLEIE